MKPHDRSFIAAMFALTKQRPSATAALGLLALCCAYAKGSLCLASQPTSLETSSDLELVRRVQDQRISVIERVTPSVVAIYNQAQKGGGSGVLIDEGGYGLTNFHVVQSMLGTRRGLGGLSDGKMYELQVLGVDPIGDLAMFRLVGRERFPYANLADSDAVEVGDTVTAMGNPFSLSEDHSPTVTMGIVTGVHRYQWGVKGKLTYSDCIQVDASINPGNSGGPLFNEWGEVIGINGRISLNTRGRLNVGFGYAITSNQARRFMPALRAGLLATHGTMQARVEHQPGRGVTFSEMLQRSPARTAGVQLGDRLLGIDGTPITSANQFASIMGTYPGRWHIELTYEHDGQRRRSLISLDNVTPDLHNPFVAETKINQRETERVVQAYRESLVCDSKIKRPDHFLWTVRREYKRAEDGAAQPPAFFLASQWGDGSAEWQRYYEDGSSGPTTVAGSNYAQRRNASGSDAFEVPADERMILAAQYLVLHELAWKSEYEDMSRLYFSGGDRVFQPVGVLSPNELPKAYLSEPLRSTEGLAEIVEAPIGSHAYARIAFDKMDHRIHRVETHDIPSGMRATLYFRDYQDVGGVYMPTVIDVLGPGYRYRDTLYDWEVVP